jgi:ribosomal peptide maturation radical SAM protein 1
MFMQNVACFAMAQRLKERNPYLVTVIGGANCESPMGQEIAKHVDQIDYVFSGPALNSFPAFLRCCLAGEMDRCEGINGVFSKRTCGSASLSASQGPSLSGPGVDVLRVTSMGGSGGGGAVATAVAPNTASAIKPFGDELDIDTEIELDYHKFLDQLEARFPGKQVEPILLFETSRGCWWGEKAHCTFCGLNGASMNYRAMSPDKAIKLFQSMFGYADRCEVFNCVDNILARNYLTDVFPRLETPSKIHLFYEVKADLSPSDMEALSKARVKIVQPGIESLATSTLKLMKKGTSAFQNILLLKNCLIHDICPQWNLLVGFPGEGEQVYQKYLRDIPLLTHLPPPSGVLPVRFDRYSPYFVKAKEYELELEPVDFCELVYPFGKQSLTNLAYYFTDTNLRAKYFLTMVKWLGKVREKFNVWKSSWKEDAPYPELFIKRVNGDTLVHDTRSGSIIEYPIGSAAEQVLDLLSKPMRVSNLASELAHIPALDLAKEVAWLQEKGLLFQEDDRYLSLVLPRELPRLSFIP